MNKLFCGYKYDGGFWFRVFGYGLAGKDIRKHPLLFSERYGYTKGIKIGNFFFHILQRNEFK